MRKLFIILSIIFAVLGIIFTILPMGNIALFPVGIAVLFSVLAVIYSKNNNKKVPKLILIASSVLFLSVIGKEVFIKDKVAYDQQFNEKKQESKQEAQKELEGLDELQ
ncbi:MAG TPA: hypothetical protein P5084_05980 [Paludibacter sp.]|nr:hypothetical protein [Paludibacter sp.]